MDAQTPLNAVAQSIWSYGRVKKPSEPLPESAQLELNSPTVEAENASRSQSHAANSQLEATSPSIDPMQGITIERNPSIACEATTQQFPSKKITRPQSAHGNPLEGFTFEKAQPMNANMTRIFGSTAIVDLPPASGHITVDCDKQTSGTASGLAKSPAVELVRHSELRQSPRRPDEPEVEKEQSHQPLAIQALGHLGDCSQQAAANSHPALASSPPHELIELLMCPDKDPERQPLTLEKCSVRTTIDGEPKQTAPARTPTRSKPHRDMRRPMQPSQPTTPTGARPPLGAKFKVTKFRRKASKPLISIGKVSNGIEHEQSSLTDEELLAVLLSRYRTEKEIRDQERTAHATEVQDLKDISNSIWDQLQESLAREQLQYDELSRFRSNQPKLVEKVKSLSKYVEGLNRDHHALRDKARAIQEEQAELQQEKECLIADVHGIRQHYQAAFVDCKAALSEARHEINLQCHTATAQQAQMQETARSLSLERGRNDLILAKIEKCGIGHQNFAQASAAQGSDFIAKLNIILSKLEDLQPNEESGSYQELKAIMCQCTATVDMLRDSGIVTTEDIRHLETSIRASANGITDALQSCRNEVNSLNTDPQDLVNKVKEDLQSLSDNIKTDRSLADQIAKHCTANAVLEEKVNASNAAVQEARQRIAAMQDIEVSLKQKVSDLEMEAVTLRKQAHDSPETLNRLREIDMQNKAIQHDMQVLRETNTEASKLLQAKFEDYSHVQLRLEELNHQLGEERVKATQVAEEHIAFVKRLTAEQEDQKAHLLAKAQLDRSTYEAERRAEVHKFNDQRASLEAHIAKEAQELEQLRKEKTNADELAETRLAMLAELQKGKDAAELVAQEHVQSLSEVTANAETLRAAAAGMELRVEESNTQLANVQRSFRKCIHELETAQAKIRGLEAENLEKVIEARQASEARQAAEDRLAMQTRKANEARKALHVLRSLNGTQGCADSAVEAQQRENGTTAKSRRKADRSGIQSSSHLVEDSQSQRKTKSLEHESTHTIVRDIQSQGIPEPPAFSQEPHTTTPSRRRFSFAPEENTESRFGTPSDFEDLFPPTPNPGSQAVKPTVNFVEDSLMTTKHYSTYTSSSRGHLASDFLETDLEYLPEPADKETQTMPHTPRGPQEFTQPTTISPRHLVLADDVAATSCDPQSTRVSVLPKGILKTGRPMKRTADSAGLASDSQRSKGNRHDSNSEKVDLTIPDSQARSRTQGTQSQSYSLGSVQSQSQSQTRVTLSQRRRGRPAKTKAAKSKADKMTRYFSQEMEKDAE